MLFCALALAPTLPVSPTLPLSDFKGDYHAGDAEGKGILLAEPQSAALDGIARYRHALGSGVRDDRLTPGERRRLVRGRTPRRLIPGQQMVLVVAELTAVGVVEDWRAFAHHDVLVQDGLALAVLQRNELTVALVRHAGDDDQRGLRDRELTAAVDHDRRIGICPAGAGRVQRAGDDLAVADDRQRLTDELRHA